MACKGVCLCCYGACCKDGECSIQSCFDCAFNQGKWQGAATTCVDGDCPCDPPADHALCERCYENSVQPRCEEGELCCYSIECCVYQCAECCDDEDCPPEHICVLGKCIRNDGCEADNDCIDTECCTDGYCEPIACPLAGIDGTWCSMSKPPTAFEASFTEYNYGDDCKDADPPTEKTQYWFVRGNDPDEIQEPGGAYTYPVPGASAPTGKTCRYVWRVWVGYGPQSVSSPNLSQPTKCEGKMYYLWMDVNRCEPTGGPTMVTEDTSYDWGTWPTGCSEGCDTDANSCFANPPSFSVTFAP